MKFFINIQTFFHLYCGPGGLFYWPFQFGAPGVSLTLCCFVVYSTRQFVLCFSLCYFVLVFFSPFSIAITLLVEKRTCISYVCSICACLVLSVSFSTCCLGRAAVCDCGIPWTFLLPFLSYFFFFFFFLIIFILDKYVTIFYNVSMSFILCLYFLTFYWMFLFSYLCITVKLFFHQYHLSPYFSF